MISQNKLDFVISQIRICDITNSILCYHKFDLVISQNELDFVISQNLISDIIKSIL